MNAQSTHTGLGYACPISNIQNSMASSLLEPADALLLDNGAVRPRGLLFMMYAKWLTHSKEMNIWWIHISCRLLLISRDLYQMQQNTHIQRYSSGLPTYMSTEHAYTALFIWSSHIHVHRTRIYSVIHVVFPHTCPQNTHIQRYSSGLPTYMSTEHAYTALFMWSSHIHVHRTRIYSVIHLVFPHTCVCIQIYIMDSHMILFRPIVRSWRQKMTHGNGCIVAYEDDPW